MLFVEQVIYKYMKDYANSSFSGSERAAMLTAADPWRLPYRDWAVKKLFMQSCKLKAGHLLAVVVEMIV